MASEESRILGERWATASVQPDELAISVCGCGYPLYALRDIDGARCGVAHKTYEEEDHHNAYFSGVQVEIPKDTDAE